jgi:phosphohistidine swiveling domain-containing protein
MSKISFSTKAQTLLALQNQLRTCQILPLKIVTVSQWLTNSDICLKEIAEKFGSVSLIVRSSSKHEDQQKKSNAGAFKTIQHVSLPSLSNAINEVISSYRTQDPDEEILIQPMLHGVNSSGVAFSHDPNSCSPYRTVNIAVGPDTNQVTSGIGGRLFHHAAESPMEADPLIVPILRMIEELLEVFENIPLDCEFASTLDNGAETLWLLQVRRLVLNAAVEPVQEQTARLNSLEKRLRLEMKPHPFCKGNTTIYGVMPDWNPAEIIGLRPAPLALSLYKELITDSIWAYQRNNYGYRNLRSFPLMVDFFGTPYIDTRVSFNSFIPADIDESLADRLVNYYLYSLRSEPSLHDKVEFEVVFACHTFDVQERIQKLKNFEFSNHDCQTIIQSLKLLTKKITDPNSGYWIKDAQKIRLLEARRERLQNSDLDLASQIYWLIEDAKRFGSLPFAGIARAAFIAVANIKSLVALDVLSTQDAQDFMMGISTVSKTLAEDRAKMTKDDFLRTYGHLRPGTYDITSIRYDEDPSFYFDWENQDMVCAETNSFELTPTQLSKISKLQCEQGFEPDPTGLMRFIKTSIELREYAKFEFTHNLSDAIQKIAKLGESQGFSRAEMAFCDFQAISEMAKTSRDPKNIIDSSIREGIDRFESTKRISLPPLITQPQDVWSFELSEIEPNFIGLKTVTKQVTNKLQRAELIDKIVLIPNADPGFDWIFTCGIAGLITEWGGANSHMAIRASEIDLPAAIGVGQIRYENYTRANRLSLDCRGRRISVVE